MRCSPFAHDLLSSSLIAHLGTDRRPCDLTAYPIGRVGRASAVLLLDDGFKLLFLFFRPGSYSQRFLRQSRTFPDRVAVFEVILPPVFTVSWRSFYHLADLDPRRAHGHFGTDVSIR